MGVRWKAFSLLEHSLGGSKFETVNRPLDTLDFQLENAHSTRRLPWSAIANLIASLLSNSSAFLMGISQLNVDIYLNLYSSAWSIFLVFAIQMQFVHLDIHLRSSNKNFSELFSSPDAESDRSGELWSFFWRFSESQTVTHLNEDPCFAKKWCASWCASPSGSTWTRDLAKDFRWNNGVLQCKDVRRCIKTLFTNWEKSIRDQFELIEFRFKTVN